MCCGAGLGFGSFILGLFDLWFTLLRLFCDLLWFAVVEFLGFRFILLVCFDLGILYGMLVCCRLLRLGLCGTAFAFGLFVVFY